MIGCCKFVVQPKKNYVGLYLKLFSFLWGLFIFNGAIAQSTYIVGQPVSDSLGALGWNSNGNCFANDWADFTLEYVDCNVTGLSYVFILTEVLKTLKIEF